MNTFKNTDVSGNEVKIELSFIQTVARNAVARSKWNLERALSDIQNKHMENKEISSVATGSLVNEASNFAAANQLLNAVNAAFTRDTITLIK